VKEKIISFFKKYRWHIPSFFVALFVIIFFYPYGCSRTETIETKVFKIGRDPIWTPLDSFGKGKNLVAFSNELLVAVAREGNFRFQIENAEAKALIDGLEDGDFDAIFRLISPDVSNKKTYYFSDPIILTGPVLMMRKDEDFATFRDLEGKTVGVLHHTSLLHQIDSIPTVFWSPFGNWRLALESLQQNKIDAVLIDTFPAYTYIKSYYKNYLHVVTGVLIPEGFRLITLQQPLQKEFIEKFNEGLQKVKDKGIYQKLLDKWDLPDYTIEAQQLPKEAMHTSDA